MPLKKEYIRDFQHRVLGSVTSGFATGNVVVRDGDGRLLGRTNDRIQETRDSKGRIISSNAADPGLLIRTK
jgi:hypothetical protein